MDGVTTISYNELMVICVFVIGILQIYRLIAGARKDHRDEVKEKSEPITLINKRLDEHEAWLGNDKRHFQYIDEQLDELKKHNAEQDKQANITIRSLLAILRHMQYGNNMAGMKECEVEITNHLTGKDKE